MKKSFWGFCILVLIGITFLVPESAKAEDQYTCILEITNPPVTLEELYSKIGEKCPDFDYGYLEYGVVVFQHSRLIMSMENSALGSVPPIVLSYPERTPLLVGVGRTDIVKTNAVFSFTKNQYGVTLNDRCVYNEIILGGGGSYWAVGSIFPYSIEECASLLGK